ncbi:MAG: polyprenol monophosphomannose synthase [Pirellulales bacterium]
MSSSEMQATDIGRTLILVCTYNEIANLPTLIDCIRRLCQDDILVIDDASPDGTAEWVRQRGAVDPSVKLMERQGKLGLGTAILAGMKYAIDHGYDWVLNLDADMSHDPASIVSLKAKAGNDVDLVIGSRYVSGGGLRNCSWKRHLVSRCANLYAKILVWWNIADCSSAFRCYRTHALKQLPLDAMRCEGYGFLEEVLWWLLRHGFRVVEVPIVYTEREQGESKISMREAIGTMKTLHHLSWMGFFVPKRRRL